MGIGQLGSTCLQEHTQWLLILGTPVVTHIRTSVVTYIGNIDGYSYRDHQWLLIYGDIRVLSESYLMTVRLLIGSLFLMT